MYTIFRPLDADERLPRELLMDAKRQRAVGRREVAGLLWLPALLVTLTLAAWINLDGFWTLGMIGLLFLGFCAFAVSDRR